MKSEPSIKVLREDEKEIVLSVEEFRKLINKIKELQRANDFLNKQNEDVNDDAVR